MLGCSEDDVAQSSPLRRLMSSKQRAVASTFQELGASRILFRLERCAGFCLDHPQVGVRTRFRTEGQIGPLWRFDSDVVSRDPWHLCRAARYATNPLPKMPSESLIVPQTKRERGYGKSFAFLSPLGGSFGVVLILPGAQIASPFEKAKERWFHPVTGLPISRMKYFPVRQNPSFYGGETGRGGKI